MKRTAQAAEPIADQLVAALASLTKTSP